MLETIRLLRRELADRVPLIGFGGAPFTLAAYAIEGGPSTNYAKAKAFMYAQPEAWHRLCDRFARFVADYMRAQVEAGAQAMQIFDSWAGQLSRADYREFALPHTRLIFDTLAGSGVPTIHFGVNTGAILADMAEAGGDVIGVDWRAPLDESWDLIGHDRGDPGQPRSGPAARPGAIGCSTPPTISCAAPPAVPAISSISATASFPDAARTRPTLARTCTSGGRRLRADGSGLMLAHGPKPTWR